MSGNIRSTARVEKTSSYDQGLRAHLVRTFGYMFISLLITAFSAFAVIHTELRSLFFSVDGSHTILGSVSALAPIAFVLLFSFKINSISSSTARTMLFIYSAIIGTSLAPLLAYYTNDSIAHAFFVSASLFASMALYGHMTKRDLSKMGSFLMMGMIGIIITSVVNMFLKSGPVDFAVSLLGVAIFTGITAWDVQKVVRIYDALPSEETRGKAAVLGALSLYMNFINIFIHLLRLSYRREK